MKNKALFIQSILLLIILIMLITMVYFLLLPKNVFAGLDLDYDYNYCMWKELYKYDDNQLEVISVGSSHSNCSIMPPILSDKLNVDCYNLSTTGASVDMIRYQLEEILKYQTPKIVTLELFSLFDLEDKIYDEKAVLGMRLSPLKYRAVKQFLPDEVADNLFPMSQNHMNWKAFQFPNDIIRAYKHDTTLPYDGYLLFSNAFSFEDGAELPDISTQTWDNVDLSDTQTDALEQIAEMCEEKGIKLVFVISPYIAQSDLTYRDMMARLPAIESFCSKHDISLVNYLLLQNEIGLTLDDFSDPGHMNVYGAVKVSSYLADYLSDNCDSLFDNSVWDTQAKTVNEIKTLHDNYDFDIP